MTSNRFARLLGIVEQDVFLFDGTIAQNIAYARRDATPEEIRAAAEAANATEFIDRMTDGMQTVIGERGVRLSGGQRQRLAIARAILADPKLLILDEATSNLDTDSERLIQQSLGDLMRGRTSFVIAHRLSTISRADLIVVIEHGRISQTGTHAELMSKGGKYRTMVEQQIHMTLGNITTNAAAEAIDNRVLLPGSFTESAVFSWPTYFVRRNFSVSSLASAAAASEASSFTASPSRFS